MLGCCSSGVSAFGQNARSRGSIQTFVGKGLSGHYARLWGWLQNEHYNKRGGRKAPKKFLNGGGRSVNRPNPMAPCKQYLLWALNYMNKTYFGLCGSLGELFRLPCCLRESTGCKATSFLRLAGKVIAEQTFRGAPPQVEGCLPGLHPCGPLLGLS